MSDSSTSRDSRARRWLTAALTASFCLPAANALDPNREISRYIHDQWSAAQGFPGGAVSAIAQTADGYLWIGGENGLVRFDGVSFHLFRASDSPSLPAGPVLGLATDAEGDLWIRMEKSGLIEYRAGSFREVFQGESPETGVTAMGRGSEGSVLLARPGDPVRFDHGRLKHIAQHAPNSGRLVISIAETPDGTLWMGTRDAGLFRFRGSDVSAADGLPDLKVNCLLPAGDAGLWAGTDNGLARWNGAEMSADGVPASLGHAQVLALARDRHGNIWAGTARGLARIDEHGADAWDRGVGRWSKTVAAVFEDREGNLWVGGTQGIERYRDSVFLTYSSTPEQGPADDGPLYIDEAGRAWYGPSGGGLAWLRGSQRGKVNLDGLGRDVVYSIAGGPGELWVGRQRGGLTRLREQNGSFAVRTYTEADGLAPGAIYSVLRTRDGTVWAGTLNGGVTRVREGHLTTYTTGTGLASNSVSAIEEGANGDIWFATPKGLLSFSGQHWLAGGIQGVLPPARVNCLTEDSGGVLWIGTGAGLAFLRAGRLETPSQPPAALVDEILGIADDGRGFLWIATAGQVVRAPRAGLLGERAGAGEVRLFGPGDGIAATEGVRRQRSVVADRLGRIWFSLHGGMAVVDPSRVATTPAPALVHIQGVAADGQPLDASGPLRVPASRRRISFSYIGLSLSVPGRVRYRYRLDGFDRDWSEASAARTAVYTNLNPGGYRFRVAACNSEGIWNSADATLGLEIVPPVWQTAWFRLATALACMLGAAGVYRLRLRQLTGRLNLRFEERLAERTRIAQELHDTLLQGFLSASMQVHVAADRLPLDSPVKPMLARALELMRQVTEEGRNAVRGLRSSPSASLDLEHAFSRIPHEMPDAASEAPSFRVVVEGQPRPLHPLLRDEVYRIGREALVNAFRHARARRIELELHYSARGLRLLVLDDGRGIDPEIVGSGRDGHYGLPGMRERADRIGARFHVRSRASAGTEIELSVPSHVAFTDHRHQSGGRTWLRLNFSRRPQRREPETHSGAGK